MSVQNKVRKGDIVAIRQVRSISYAFGSGRGTEREAYFTLARVSRASREGEAREVVMQSGHVSKIRDLRDVSTVPPRWAKIANELFEKGSEFQSTDAIRDEFRKQIEGNENERISR